MVDWSGALRSRDSAQGVVQCHVQFLCVWASAPDRCTVLGGEEDQSLGGDAKGLRCGYPGGSGELIGGGSPRHSNFFLTCLLLLYTTHIPTHAMYC